MSLHKRNGSSQETPGSHWFNIYVEEIGKIHWTDEQVGVVGD